MKHNDKAIEAALSVTQIPEENMREYMRRVLTAAFAAQFQSEDYAGLVKESREDVLHFNLKNTVYKNIAKDAADAIEAVLAELEACKKGNDSYHDQSIENHNKQVELNKRIGQLEDENKILAKACAGKYVDIGEFEGDKLKHMLYNTIIERNEAVAERDALLARLAPVDDKELVEIGAKAMARPPFYQWKEMSDTNRQRTKMVCRAAIAAIRPHIEAAEKERCVKAVEKVAERINVAQHERSEWEDGYLQGVHDAATAIRSGK